MADDRLSENNPSLNLPDAKLSIESQKERMFLLLEQLGALLKVAEHGDITQHPEATLYHYFDVMQEQLADLKSVCEWLGRRVLPDSKRASSA